MQATRIVVMTTTQRIKYEEFGEPHTHVDDDEDEYDVGPTLQAEDALVSQTEHTQKFDQEVISKEEWLQILKEKEVIDKLLFGKGTLLGTTNQVDDEKFAIVNIAVVEAEEELEVIDTLKVFEEELQLIK